MKLYHGSDRTVERPRADASRTNLDFGQGFYLTSHKEQAERWAKRKALRSGRILTVNVYEFDEECELRTKAFLENDAPWVEFVCSHRKGDDAYREFNLIIGRIADDQVFRAVDMYYRGI